MALGMLLLLAVLAPGAGWAGALAPRAELWERWLAHDATSMRTLDHGDLEQFLVRYLRIGTGGGHRVAYAEVDEQGRAMLERYLARLAAVPLEHYNRDQQLAYWINLYNALMLRLVLDHYPVASILGIGSGPGGTGGPWQLELIEVAGVWVSLADIEHRILRPIWRDPRVHYALSCAAVSCPSLHPEPYRGEVVDAQLSAAAMAYVNDRRCIQVERGRLLVSSLFRWYREDFGGSDHAVISHLMAYAEPRLAMALQRFDDIDGDMFDWRLNDAAAASARR